MADRIQVSVVVPCYNEEKNIPLAVKRFLGINFKGIGAELILVDNGSSDNSRRIIKDYTKDCPFIRPVSVKKNIGYGNGIWAGLKKARGEYLCWTHADMQTDLADTLKAYDIIKKQKNPKNCFVKGNRKKRPFIDAFFMYGMSLFETLMLKTALFDINAQPNLFHRDFIRNISDPPKDFSFDLYFYYIAKQKGYDVLRFSVLFPKRIHGESNWNTSIKEKWKFIKRTVGFSFKLKKMLDK